MGGDSASEAMETAIKTEQEGQEFYLKVAAASGNKLARGMFEALAADEKRHEEWIRANIAYKVVPEKGLEVETNRKLQTIFSSVTEAEMDSFASSEDDTAALKKALEIERTSVELYESRAQWSPSREVASLWKILAIEERSHVRIVTNMLEYLNDTGSWFMGEEGWSFDGGGSFA